MWVCVYVQVLQGIVSTSVFGSGTEELGCSDFMFIKLLCLLKMLTFQYIYIIL